MTAKAIGVLQVKGGAGSSTLATNLAVIPCSLN